MKKDYNLEFIKSKIQQTGTALCNLHLPGISDTSYIIHTNSVDDEGNINFSLADTFPNSIKQDLDSFGIRLFYYRKGLGYFMNIEAAATATQSLIHDGTRGNEDEKVLSVKARILAAEYSESNKNYKTTGPGFMRSFRQKIMHMAAGFI